MTSHRPMPVPGPPSCSAACGRTWETAGDGLPRPRCAATARLDLALALAGADQMDDAAAAALDAVTSGLLVPSSYWRAGEVISAIGDAPGTGELQEAYCELCRASPRELA
jgi:hypothetical protein